MVCFLLYVIFFQRNHPLITSRCYVSNGDQHGLQALVDKELLAKRTADAFLRQIVETG